MKAVYKEQFAKGIVVSFFVGYLEMESNGEVFTARGAVSADGKRMWIQADNPTITVSQIAKHEEFHALIKKDATLLDVITQNPTSNESTVDNNVHYQRANSMTIDQLFI